MLGGEAVYPDKRLVDPRLSAPGPASFSKAATDRKASELPWPKARLAGGLFAVGPEDLAGSKAGLGEAVVKSPWSQKRLYRLSQRAV
jgi:hypothetical protein